MMVCSKHAENVCLYRLLFDDAAQHGDGGKQYLLKEFNGGSLGAVR
jgi:hypothetical protein